MIRKNVTGSNMGQSPAAKPNLPVTLLEALLLILIIFDSHKYVNQKYPLFSKKATAIKTIASQKKRAELPVIAQQARPGNITDSTLKMKIAHFPARVKD